MTSGFGAAGPLVALLVWTYYSSQIVFLGAEFIWILGRNNGHPVLPSKHAVKVVKKTSKLEAAAAERNEKRELEREGIPTDLSDGDRDRADREEHERSGDPAWPTVGHPRQAGA